MAVPGDPLMTSTLSFARALAALSDERLTSEWPAASQAGGFWFGYDDTPRELAFRVYLQLQELATAIEHQRTAPSEAQRLLARHRLAYRDLTGALAGVPEALFDTPPDEHEWPLRTVLFHIALTERGFHALIDWAVNRRRTGNAASIVMPDDHRDAVSEPVVEDGSMSDVLERYAALHAKVLAEFATLTDADLDAPNIWWEGYEVPVRVRILRFDAHLREHTIQVDKTQAGIGHPPSEPERMARLLHHALGRLEGACIGSDVTLLERQHRLAAEIDSLTAPM